MTRIGTYNNDYSSLKRRDKSVTIENPVDLQWCSLDKEKERWQVFASYYLANNKTSLFSRVAGVFLEHGLIIASVMIFRSIWMLLDQMQWAHSSPWLWFMLIIGIVLATLMLMAIHKDKNS